MSNQEQNRAVAIIPSAGMGRRMGSQKKNYLELLGRPVLSRTIEPFEASALVDAIIVVVPSGDEAFCKENIVGPYGFKKVVAIVAGGKERQDSVENGVKTAGTEYDIVIVHDGARPLVTTHIIEAAIRAAAEDGAALVGVSVKDTIKETSAGYVRATLNREALLSVQTPQAFRLDVLKEAFRKARQDGFQGTDESSIVERTGQAVRIVEGSYENIKITTPEDLVFAECVLKKREKVR